MRLQIEAPFVLLMFAFVFSDPITVNLIVYRTCYLTLGFNETDCALLGTKHHDNNTDHMEKEVQPYVTVLTMTKSLIETFITAILCFFLGPWSDRYGRRPVMLFVLTGYTIAYCIITVISALPHVTPWFLLLSTIPICLFGGFPAFMTATICYITDVTSRENRGLRLGIFEALITTSSLIGSISSSFVFNGYGYVAVYLITTGCIFMSWICLLVAIPESVENPETEGKFRNLFKFSLVTDTVRTTLKRREGYDRALLLTVIALTIIFLLAVTADAGIVFLYLRRKLSWSLEKYTLYTSGRKIAWVTGSMVGGYILNKLLNVEESVLMLLGFASTLSTVAIQGVATKDWHMYLAGSLICLGGSISPMTRSLISKIVPSEECGRVFSFVIITETFVNLIGSPIYTYIYNNTINTLPGAFNFVTTGIYAFEVLLTIPAIIIQMNRGDVLYQGLIDDSVSVSVNSLN